MCRRGPGDTASDAAAATLLHEPRTLITGVRPPTPLVVAASGPIWKPASSRKFSVERRCHVFLMRGKSTRTNFSIVSSSHSRTCAVDFCREKPGGA
jgi:hypothetical protein